LQRVSSFKEKLKWGTVAEQHASLYRYIIDGRSLSVAGISNSKSTDDNNMNVASACNKESA